MSISYIGILIKYSESHDFKILRLVNKQLFDALLDRFWELYVLHINIIKDIPNSTKTVRRIKFGYSFSEISNALAVSNTLSNFDDLDRETLRNYIKLISGQNIDKLVINFPNLHTLVLDDDFNISIDALAGGFPNLHTLDFGWRFNQNVDALASSFPNLHTLKFGFKFNQNINALANSFPNLKILIVSSISSGYTCAFPFFEFIKKHPQTQISYC